MIYGFTGTKNGATDAQLATVNTLINYGDFLHHGGCKGADTQVHHLALGRASIRIHPGPAFNIITDCLGADLVYEELPNLERNKVIVMMCDTLIATPKEFTEINRSGTWMTIRYARKKNRQVIIVWPDGMRT